jgi:hypothetical protein
LYTERRRVASELNDARRELALDKAQFKQQQREAELQGRRKTDKVGCISAD